jgi:hypothetical protein
MRAIDGTLLEVFEWESAEAVELAHKDPTVIEMWDRFSKVCEFVSLSTLKEVGEPFPHFTPVDL